MTKFEKYLKSKNVKTKDKNSKLNGLKSLFQHADNSNVDYSKVLKELSIIREEKYAR